MSLVFSDITLRYGIESAITGEIPQIKRVIAVDDSHQD